MSVVLKWPVPVDDQDHAIGNGRVVLVGSQGEHGTVYVWTIEPGVNVTTARKVRVVGTGHPNPGDDWVHIGSTIAGPFVWHVFAWAPF